MGAECRHQRTMAGRYYKKGFEENHSCGSTSENAGAGNSAGCGDAGGGGCARGFGAGGFGVNFHPVGEAYRD